MIAFPYFLVYLWHDFLFNGLFVAWFSVTETHFRVFLPVKNMPAYIISSLSDYDNWHERIEGTKYHQFISKCQSKQTNKQFKFTSSASLISERKRMTHGVTTIKFFLYALIFRPCAALFALCTSRNVVQRLEHGVLHLTTCHQTLWKSRPKFKHQIWNEFNKRSVGQNSSRNLKGGAIRMKRERGIGKEERAMGCYLL